VHEQNRTKSKACHFNVQKGRKKNPFKTTRTIEKSKEPLEEGEKKNGGANTFSEKKSREEGWPNFFRSTLKIGQERFQGINNRKKKKKKLAKNGTPKES